MGSSWRSCTSVKYSRLPRAARGLQHSTDVHHGEAHSVREGEDGSHFGQILYSYSVPHCCSMMVEFSALAVKHRCA
jgi:hypothetical protein